MITITLLLLYSFQSFAQTSAPKFVNFQSVLVDEGGNVLYDIQQAGPVLSFLSSIAFAKEEMHLPSPEKIKKIQRIDNFKGIDKQKEEVSWWSGLRRQFQVFWKEKWWRGQLYPIPCGNGALDSGEECDDGNRTPGDGCGDDCTIECEYPFVTAADRHCPSTCGNGILEIGEACDDGNETESDNCRSNCTIPRCGDGIVDVAHGEECDGGFNCTETCHPVPPTPCVCDKSGCEPHPVPSSDPQHEQCSDPATPWTRTIGAEALADHVSGFAVDSNGTIYVLFTSHTVEGVMSFRRFGEQDVILQQRDTCGNLVWERVISSAFTVTIDHLAVDVCGNSYIAINDGGILVRKYNFWGDVEWEDRSDGSGHDASIAVDSERNVVYVTSSFPLVEESNRLGVYVGYAWIRKYDAEDGSIIWTLDDELVEIGQSARVAADIDSEGNLYTILNESPFVLVRLDPSGNINWSILLSGALYQMLAVGTGGEIILTRTGLSFEPSGQILKYASADGSLLGSYLSSVVSPYGRSASGIAIDSDHNILVTGIDFDNAVIDVADDYFWLIKLGPTFETLWTDTLNMPLPALNYYSRRSLVGVDPAGFVYVAATMTTTENDVLDGQDIMLRKYTPIGEE